jgi:hypothetical protein
MGVRRIGPAVKNRLAKDAAAKAAKRAAAPFGLPYVDSVGRRLVAIDGPGTNAAGRYGH